jgi:hypothetical protein
MNDIYLYQHHNGLQFLSNAKPLFLSVYYGMLKKEKRPKLIGTWRLKKFK